MSEAVYGVVSVYDHAELLPHFLEHYARLGVRMMLVSVRDEEAYERVRTLATDYPARIVYTPAAFFADSDKAAVEAALVDTETDDPDAYVMHLDLDEFQEYPAPLRAVVAEMNRHEDWAIRGWIVDRLAPGGELSPVRSSPTIFEQFPVEAHVSANLLGAWTQKIMLCRKRVRLKGGCRHDTENAYYDRVPIGDGGQYRVLHFKWLAGLAERLERRLNEPGTGGPYQRECRAFLDHYRRHGRIDLTAPGLHPRLVGAFDYAPRVEQPGARA